MFQRDPHDLRNGETIHVGVNGVRVEMKDLAGLHSPRTASTLLAVGFRNPVISQNTHVLPAIIPAKIKYWWSDTCSGWGILIFYDNSLAILSLVFHSSFKQCCPLGSSYLVGRVLSIVFFVSDYDSLPYLLVFRVGITFPLVALDKIHGDILPSQVNDHLWVILTGVY